MLKRCFSVNVHLCSLDMSSCITFSFIHVCDSLMKKKVTLFLISAVHLQGSADLSRCLGAVKQSVQMTLTLQPWPLPLAFANNLIFKHTEQLPQIANFSQMSNFLIYKTSIILTIIIEKEKLASAKKNQKKNQHPI